MKCFRFCRPSARLALWAFVGFSPALVQRAVATGTLTGAFSSLASGSNVNLTAVGKLDWVHWGLYTDTSVDRKADMPHLIGEVSVVGFGSNYLTYYQYNNNANGYTWFDGAPDASVTNTPTGIWAYQASMAGSAPVGSGFQFSVAADTTVRTLQVFVGAYAAKGQLTATLSDGSATAWTSSQTQTVDNFGAGPDGVFTLNYAANSPNAVLTVVWKVAGIYTTPTGSANVTLQAAAVTQSGADNPPFILLTNPPNGTAYAEPANLLLQATAQDFDGTVTNVTFYAGANKLGSLNAAPYEWNWNNVSRGDYWVSGVATDNQGVSRASDPVEVFVYGSGGALAGAVATAGPSVDLTAEGTSDWVHWGLAEATSVDRKSTVEAQIQATVLGGATPQQYGDNYTSFAWSDGAPTLSCPGTTSGIFVTGATSGFSLSAPADPQLRTLRVYVGLYGAQGRFEAKLSDLSAPPYIDRSLANEYGSSYAVYTLSYSAASAGQQLQVTYQPETLYDLTYGNLTLPAATLEGGTPTLAPVTLSNPKVSGSDFIFSFLTLSNHTYTPMYSPRLPASKWTALPTVPGTGGLVTVTNSGVVGSTPGFYRVQQN